MAAGDAGRNLSAEMDEMKEKLEQMAQTQERLEAILLDLKDSLITSRARVTESDPPPFSLPMVSVPMGVSSQGYVHTTEPINIPIGEGYQPAGNMVNDLQGTGGPTWGPPHVHSTGVPVATPKANSTSFSEKNKRKEEWMERMEEEIKAIKGISSHGLLRVEELCPATDITLPKDFKVPDFVKYDGTGNPRFHLISYATKMCVWSKEDKFLICFFHESLTGPALEWYLQLNHSKIGRWTELADLFMEQYRFNMDMAPTREELGSMQKKKGESFKEYAARWRALALQVRPEMRTAEMNSYFLGTLGAPFIGAMAGVAYKDFTELTQAGERIEMLLRAGKLQSSEGERRGFQPRRRENEVSNIQAPTSRYQFNNIPTTQNSTQTTNTNLPHNVIRTSYSNPPTHQTNQMRPTNSQNPNTNSQNPNTNPRQNPNRPYPNLPPFPRLGISNAELFKQLMDRHLIAPYPVRPIESNFPSWYNANLTCKYHMDVPGHSIEDCEQFKTAVRRLIACGKLEFEEEAGPSIMQNPIPNHNQGNKVNAVDVEAVPIKKVLGLRVSMRDLFLNLKKAGYNILAPEASIKEEGMYDPDSFCSYHHGSAGHDIEDCWDFKARVQGLLTLGVIQAYQSKPTCQTINVIEKVTLKVPFLKDPRPAANESTVEKVTLKVSRPKPFEYSDTHTVPWRYDMKVEAVAETSDAQISNVDGRMTRSGRYYGLPQKEEKKDPGFSHGEEGDKGTSSENLPSKEEEEEFLKIVKQSEYDVVEQLKKTPSRISLLSLVLSSELHRNALLKVLSGAFVKPEVTTERMINMVDPVKHVNCISFFDREVVTQRDKFPRALYITLECRGHMVAKVLIDGGSALNVIPKSTLAEISVDTSEIKPIGMMVQAFDGNPRGTLGEIELPLKIGPSVFSVLFQVMDINPSYTMLLGRPWIHEAGAVPSTLHQAVKFVKDDRIITVRGEKEIMLSQPVSVPYVENIKENSDGSLHAFEVIEDVSYKGKEPVRDVDKVVAQIMASNGYQEGKGLGSKLQGTQSFISVPEKLDKFGLGYEATLEEKMRSLTINKKSSQELKKPIPHIRETFPVPSEVIIPNVPVCPQNYFSVNALDDEAPKEEKVIYKCGEPLQNWEAEPVIDVIGLK